MYHVVTMYIHAYPRLLKSHSVQAFRVPRDGPMMHLDRHTVFDEKTRIIRRMPYSLVTQLNTTVLGFLTVQAFRGLPQERLQSRRQLAVLCTTTQTRTYTHNKQQKGAWRKQRVRQISTIKKPPKQRVKYLRYSHFTLKILRMRLPNFNRIK